MSTSPFRRIAIFAGLIVVVFAVVFTVLPSEEEYSGAPADLSETLHTEQGSVQFYGLNTMSPRTVLDTLREIAPEGRQLAQCVTLLEQKFGFPDVAPFVWEDSSGTKRYLYATSGPDAAAHVQFRSFPSAEEPHIQWFKELRTDTSEIKYLQSTIIHVIRNYEPALRGHADSTRIQALNTARGRVDTQKVDLVLSFLQSHKAESDLDEAIQILANDGNNWNRLIALAIVSNFPSSPDAWKELTGSLRDPYDPASFLALNALQTFAAYQPDAASWKPALPSLRAVLGGTNYLLTPYLLEVLNKTEIKPELGRELLRGRGGRMLLAHVQSGEPRMSPSIRTLFHNASGSRDPEDWKKWLNQ